MSYLPLIGVCSNNYAPMKPIIFNCFTNHEICQYELHNRLGVASRGCTTERLFKLLPRPFCDTLKRQGRVGRLTWSRADATFTLYFAVVKW